jgi:predicted nucleic acid-binding protein
LKALLDTSVFIAQEAGRSVDRLPDEGTISVVTLAELTAGVLLASDLTSRARRLLTLARAEEGFEAIPIDVEVARSFATLYSAARSQGHRPKAMDLWIAATAVRHNLVLFTQDNGFDGLPGLQLAKV